jgi:hypothetical protein
MAISDDLHDCLLLCGATEVVSTLSAVSHHIGYSSRHWLSSFGDHVQLESEHCFSG